MNNTEVLLELYKTMSATITATELRRQQAYTVFASFFLGLGTAFTAIEGFQLWQFAAASTMVGLLWTQTVLHFKNIAEAKFKVVLELEEKFTYQPYKIEWDYLKSKTSSSLIVVELIVPFSISIVSFALLFFEIYYFAVT